MNNSAIEQYKKAQDKYEFQTSNLQNFGNSDQIWEGDVLDRKKLAETLTRLVENQKQPFVLCLDGSWGTGKTFLLERWHKSLECKKFQGVYYNAWEDDFSDDPFLSLIGQISESLSANKDYSEQVKKICGATGEVLNQVTEKAIGINIKKVAKSLENKQIEDYKTQRERKNRLKHLLKGLANNVREYTGKPLIFIIDELVRWSHFFGQFPKVCSNAERRHEHGQEETPFHGGVQEARGAGGVARTRHGAGDCVALRGASESGERLEAAGC